MRLKTGAATIPPSCRPIGESSETRMLTAGLLIGAKPVKEAISCVREYRPVAGSIFCAEPVFPAAVHPSRSEEHTSELQSQSNLVCRLLLEKKKVLPNLLPPELTMWSWVWM